jgi:hypothetical protein
MGEQRMTCHQRERERQSPLKELPARLFRDVPCVNLLALSPRWVWVAGPSMVTNRLINNTI